MAINFGVNISKRTKKIPIPFKLYLLTCGILPIFAILEWRFFGLSLGTCILLLLIGFSLDYRNTAILFKKSLISKKLIIFILLIFIQILIHRVDIKLLFWYMLIIIMYFLSLNLSKNINHLNLKDLLRYIHYGAYLSFLLGIIQYTFDLQLYPAQMFEDVMAAQDKGYVHRASGGMLSPNGYGYYASLIAAVAFAEIILIKQKLVADRNIYGAYFLFLLSISQIFLSSSRSAILSVFVAILYFLFKSRIKIKYLLYTFILGLFSLYLYITYIEDFDQLIFRSLEDGRWKLWNEAIKYIVLNPEVLLFGLGIGDSNRSDINFSDNLFLEIILAGGIPLFLSFIYLLFTNFPIKVDYLCIGTNFNILFSFISMWRIIFLIAALFSSAIGFMPFSQLFFLFFFLQFNALYAKSKIKHK
jgi:hypothetical protein